MSLLTTLLKCNCASLRYFKFCKMVEKYLVDQLMLSEHAAEIMVYIEKHKIMPIISRLLVECALIRPDDPREWMGKNIKRISAKIYGISLAQSYGENISKRFFELPGRYLYRVAIFGRPGSGRKTMAVYLMKRFNLVLLDANQLIYQGLRSTDDLCTQMQDAFLRDDLEAKSNYVGKLIARRMLQTDALRNGWVLINYPTNLLELKELVENFKIPPNKIVYLKCSEKMAKRRLVAKPRLGSPQDNVDYIEKEMKHYSSNEEDMNGYLMNRHETIDIDSSKCAELVKTRMFSKLECTPYVMGFKVIK